MNIITEKMDGIAVFLLPLQNRCYIITQCFLSTSVFLYLN
jgi:hypothetical protein